MSTFSADRGGLTAALAWVIRAVPSRPAAPVLVGIRLRVVNGSALVSAFDYEQSAAATMAVAGDDADVIVPGRLLVDLVKAMTCETVDFAVTGNRVTISGGRATFTLPTFASDDYPTLPPVPARAGTVPGPVFADAVHRVSVAAGKDDTLPVLTAVQVHLDPATSSIRFAATDRYRLATVTVDYTPAPDAQPATVLVPARTLDGYAKTVTGADAVDVHVEAAGGALFGITVDGKTATTRLLDGQFPDFARLLPTEFTGNALFPVADVAEAVRRVALVAERSQPVRCSFTAGEIALTVGNDDASGAAAAAETVEATLDGDDVVVAFNPEYLTDGLAALGTDKARLRLVAPTKPALLVPDRDDDGYVYLLMPVRLAT